MNLPDVHVHLFEKLLAIGLRTHNDATNSLKLSAEENTCNWAMNIKIVFFVFCPRIHIRSKEWQYDVMRKLRERED